MKRTTAVWAAALVALAGAGAPAFPEEPEQLWLGWRSDPTSTMTVRWLGRPGARQAPFVSFCRDGGDTWREAAGEGHPMPFTHRVVNVVELRGLRPSAVYRFRVQGGPAVYRFRTLPATLSQPVRFVEGGDLYGRNHWYHRINPLDGFGLFREDRLTIVREVARQAARQDPAFAVVGGDITYTDGHPDRAGRWLEWLAAWKQDMVTPDSLLVPIVAVIGNHEVAGNRTRLEWEQPGRVPDPATHAPYYYSLFIAPDSLSCTALDFGDYMSLVLLDSGHTRTVAQQAGWLSEALAARAAQPYLFAVYHVPAYPSYRSFDERLSRLVRRHWVPLFERAGLTAAFEHHDHTYKRTVLIREGREDPDGVLYLGDGAWGRLRRPKRPGDRWYLARTVKAHHVYVATLTQEGCRFRAIDENGHAFDAFARPPRTAVPRP